MRGRWIWKYEDPKARMSLVKQNTMEVLNMNTQSKQNIMMDVPGLFHWGMAVVDNKPISYPPWQRVLGIHHNNDLPIRKYPLILHTKTETKFEDLPLTSLMSDEEVVETIVNWLVNLVVPMVVEWSYCTKRFSIPCEVVVSVSH